MRFLLQLVLASILGANPPLPPNVTVFNGIIRDTTGNPVLTGNVSFTLRPGIDTTTSGNARFTPATVACEMETPAITSYSGNGVTTTVNVATTEPWQVGDVLIVTGTGTTLDTSAAATYAVASTGVGGTQFTFLSNFNGSGAGGFMGGLFSPNGTGPCTVLQNSALTPAGTSYRVDIQPAGTTTSTFNTYAIGPGPIDLSTIVPTPAQQPGYSFVDLFSNGQQISGLKNFTNPLNTYQGGIFNSPVINNPTFNKATATNWLFISPVMQLPTVTQGPITLAGPFNYSLSWANPSAARSIQIPDPGSAFDSFVFAAMPQVLTNKTLGAGTVIQGGIPGMVSIIYNSPSASSAASIAPVTMFTATANSMYRFSFYVELSATGTSCASPTNIAVSLIMQDPLGAGSSTATNLGITLATTNGVLGPAAYWISSNSLYPALSNPFRAKAGTVIQYSTTYTIGGSCSPGPSYTIYPILEQLTVN